MNKKIFMFGIPLLALVLVSAALVIDWGQTQIDMEVTEALTVVGGECGFSVIAGDGNYELCLFEMENNLERELDLEITIRVQQEIAPGIYTILPDDEGVLVAATEDVGYYFDPYRGVGCDGPTATGCGPAFTEQTWEQWMVMFPDWLDWIVTQPYEGEYDVSLITNHGGNSITDISSIGVNGEYAFTETIKSLDEVQVALYVGSATGLESGNYKVIFEVAPITA